MTEERTGLEVDVFVALFELVEFFQDGDWNRNVVILEVSQATCVVQNDVGIENEELGTRAGSRFRHSILLDRRSRSSRQAEVRLGSGMLPTPILLVNAIP